MTSRLVTVDLILTTSLRLQQSLYPITEEQLSFYRSIREILDGWARQIEAQGLAVRLETIAENALEICLTSAEAGSNDLAQIGDQLIERAREIESLTLNRWVDLLSAPAREELAKALKGGEPVSFKVAAMDITSLKNVTEARDRLKEFLTWLDNWYAREGGSEASSLLNDIIGENRPLTTTAVELFKNRYFPTFEAIRALKRRKI